MAAPFHRLTPGRDRDPREDTEPEWHEPPRFDDAGWVGRMPGMDVDRHRVECWFDGEPRNTGQTGRFRFRWMCIGCGHVATGYTADNCRRRAGEHEAGKR